MSNEKPNSAGQNKQNLTQEELLWKIYKSTEKTRRYILWLKILSVIKVIIIVVPIVLAIIYLPPLLENALKPYKELLGADSQGQNVLKQFKKGASLEELMKIYK